MRLPATMADLGEFPTVHHTHRARKIARNLAVDSDDVEQDALVAMWKYDQRFRSGYENVSEYFAGCHMAGVRGAVDGLRRRTGYRKRRGIVVCGLDDAALIPDQATAVEDLAAGVLDVYAAARSAAFHMRDPRIVTIVQRLDQGATKRTIAHELHIDPARVSQLLRPLKQALHQAA